MIPFHRADFNMATRTLDVYFAGCSLACEGCHNEELWDSSGNTRSPEELMELIKSPLVKVVRYMGGEPTEQRAIRDLLMETRALGKVVWLFTGLHITGHLDEVVDYLKVGKYDCHSSSWHCKELDITLASRNQYIVECTTGKEYRYDSSRKSN